MLIRCIGLIIAYFWTVVSNLFAPRNIRFAIMGNTIIASPIVITMDTGLSTTIILSG